MCTVARRLLPEVLQVVVGVRIICELDVVRDCHGARRKEEHVGLSFTAKGPVVLSVGDVQETAHFCPRRGAEVQQFVDRAVLQPSRVEAEKVRRCAQAVEHSAMPRHGTEHVVEAEVRVRVVLDSENRRCVGVEAVLYTLA